jgi:hypothetical protein
MPELNIWALRADLNTMTATITKIMQSGDSGQLNNQALHLFNQGDLTDVKNIHL